MLTSVLTVCTVLAVLGTAEGGAYVVNPWVNFHDGPKLVKVSLGGLGGYGLDADGNVYYRGFDAKTTKWEKVDGNLKEIAVGGTEVWGVNSKNEIYRKIGKGEWTRVPGESLVQVGVDDSNSAWGVTADQTIYRYLEDGSWEKMGGLLSMVSVGPAGVWGLDKYGDIFVRSGTYNRPGAKGNGWKPIPGRMSWISSGQDIVWGVNKQGEVLYRAGISKVNKRGTKWIYIAGNLTHINTYKGHVVGLDKDNLIFATMAHWVESAYPAKSTKYNPLDDQICGDDTVTITPWVKLPHMVIADTGAAGHYAIDKKGKIWRSTNGKTGWKKEPDFDAHFTYIGVGKFMLWAVDKVGHTFTKAPGDATWIRHIPPLNEVMVQVSVSEYDAVWATSIEQSIYRWSGDYWQRVFGRAKVASVGPSGVWVITHNDDIYHRYGTRGIEPCVGHGWKLILGKSKMITSGHNIVFSINSVDNVFRRVGICEALPWGTHWVHVPGKLAQVDVYKNELWGYDINREVWSMKFGCKQAAQEYQYQENYSEEYSGIGANE